MEYKELKILSVILIIAGVIIIFGLPLLITRGYYMNWDRVIGYYLIPHMELLLVLLYCIILTLLVLVIYPILYIRKHNPNKLKKSPKELTIQVKEIPKITYCPECRIKITDTTKGYCSQCGSKITN